MLFGKILILVVFLEIFFITGIWALTPNKPKKEKLLICPKTGEREINPKDETPCVDCAKRYASA